LFSESDTDSDDEKKTSKKEGKQPSRDSTDVAPPERKNVVKVKLGAGSTAEKGLSIPSSGPSSRSPSPPASVSGKKKSSKGVLFLSLLLDKKRSAGDEPSSQSIKKAKTPLSENFVLQVLKSFNGKDFTIKDLLSSVPKDYYSEEGKALLKNCIKRFCAVIDKQDGSKAYKLK
jgi:hypothetical protein